MSVMALSTEWESKSGEVYETRDDERRCWTPEPLRSVRYVVCGSVIVNWPFPKISLSLLLNHIDQGIYNPFYPCH
jgi:hypothetical protein